MNYYYYRIHLAIVASLMVLQTQVQALIPHKSPHSKEEISRRGFAFSTISTVLLPFASNAIIDDGSQGIPAVTESSLGRSFRKSIVKGAQIADAIDEKWERFSDGLRDKSSCDPKTGRRLYDNGKRKDGTSIGNPGLGSLCNPEPLVPLNTEVVSQVLNLAVVSAAVYGRGEETLRDKIKELKALVSPSFERKVQLSTTDEEKERVRFNLEAYAVLRAITIYLNDKQSIRNFQNNWGEQLVNLFAPTASRRDYVSPFPETQDGDYDYDKGKLLDALGKLTVTLTQLKACGMIGYYEISIPYDDYGSVVTIAIDDYVPITTEILLSEQVQFKCEGPTQALVRHLFGAAGIDFSLDTFYIDPSTTKQEDYNPTQLLLSANNLRAF